MLHIIGLIFKIIGIILAVILGILVLLVCIVLFVPVRYEADGSCGGNIDSLKIRAKVSWLLHLISVKVLYKDGNLSYYVRVAWKKMALGGENDPVRTEKEPVIKKEPSLTEVPPQAEKPELEEKPESEEKPVPEEKTALEEKTASAEEPAPKEKGMEQTQLEQKLEVQSQQLEEKAAPPKSKPKQEKPKILHNLWEKIKGFFNRIKYTFQKICDKIKALENKKEILQNFIEDETHKRAFGKAKKELFYLLKHLVPKRFKVRAKYGFDDPYRTGQVLAVFSLIFPFVGEHMEIEPDFEKAVLEGDFFIKGKLRMISFVIPAWRLFWNKSIRQTYKDVRSIQK